MVLLRPDVHIQGTVTTGSQNVYRLALEPLVRWLEKHSIDPSFEDLDDLAMESKHEMVPDGRSRGPHGLTRSKLTRLLTALGHALPALRGQLNMSVSFAASRGWIKMEPNRRTFPLPDRVLPAVHPA